MIGHPADRLRQGRPDARLPQHPRHAPVRRAGGHQPGRAGRVPRLQPVHRAVHRRRARRAGASRRREQLGYSVEIQSFPNPRVELEEHYYNAANTKLRDLGLEPHYLGQELVQSMLKTIERHKDRVIERAIAPRTRWKPGELEAAVADGDAAPPSRLSAEPRTAASRPGPCALQADDRPSTDSMNGALARAGHGWPCARMLDVDGPVTEDTLDAASLALAAAGMLLQAGAATSLRRPVPARDRRAPAARTRSAATRRQQDLRRALRRPPVRQRRQRPDPRRHRPRRARRRRRRRPPLRRRGRRPDLRPGRRRPALRRDRARHDVRRRRRRPAVRRVRRRRDVGRRRQRLARRRLRPRQDAGRRRRRHHQRRRRGRHALRRRRQRPHRTAPAPRTRSTARAATTT